MKSRVCFLDENRLFFRFLAFSSGEFSFEGSFFLLNFLGVSLMVPGMICHWNIHQCRKTQTITDTAKLR